MITLQEFTRDIIPIVGVFVAATGLFFIWRQLRIVTRVFEQTSAWNRINLTYSFFDIERNMKIRYELYAIGEKLEVKFQHKLSKEHINIITNNDECFLKLKEYLNDFESLCAAYQIGALDKELAFRSFGARIVKEYSLFKPLIKYLRNMADDSAIMIEFQRTAEEWSVRLAKGRKILQEKVKEEGIKQRTDL